MVVIASTKIYLKTDVGIKRPAQFAKESRGSIEVLMRIASVRPTAFLGLMWGSLVDFGPTVYSGLKMSKCGCYSRDSFKSSH